MVLLDDNYQKFCEFFWEFRPLSSLVNIFFVLWISIVQEILFFDIIWQYFCCTYFALFSVLEIPCFWLKLVDFWRMFFYTFAGKKTWEFLFLILKWKRPTFNRHHHNGTFFSLLLGHHFTMSKRSFSFFLHYILLVKIVWYMNMARTSKHTAQILLLKVLFLILWKV